MFLMFIIKKKNRASINEITQLDKNLSHRIRKFNQVFSVTVSEFSGVTRERDNEVLMHFNSQLKVGLNYSRKVAEIITL